LAFLKLKRAALHRVVDEMAFEQEEVEFLRGATAGIPRVARAIADVPSERQPQAWQAAERGYLQTLRESGFEERAARSLVAAVMSRLRAQVSLVRIIDGELRRAAIEEDYWWARPKKAVGEN
jgi:hypothetical protein